MRTPETRTWRTLVTGVITRAICCTDAAALFLRDAKGCEHAHARAHYLGALMTAQYFCNMTCDWLSLRSHNARDFLHLAVLTRMWPSGGIKRRFEYAERIERRSRQ